MKLFDFLDQHPLDKPTSTPQALANKYNVDVDEVIRQLDRGVSVEMEHTSDPKVAREIALDHLGERLDYYEQLAKVDEEKDDQPSHAPYPGQSSGRLKNYIKRKYGGDISCRKAGSVLRDPDAGNFYKKRAKWYQSLHCSGRRQVREEDDDGAALTCFDIDDTLMRTSATVHVKKPNGTSTELSASEFNEYKLKPGEEFDFGQFNDAKLFRATSQPIENLWRTAQSTLSNLGKRPGSRVVIVTARSDMDDKDEFLQTFQDHGLDMSKVHVFRAGNLDKGTGPEKKKTIIRKLLNNGEFTETRLFDDHIENLKAFLSLKEEFPNIVFKAYPVASGKIGQPIIV